MTCYDFDYANRSLHQAIDFAEIEHDFIHLRKWVNEVEQSGHELEVMYGRLNLPADRDILTAALQSVAAGLVSPEETLLRIRLRLPIFLVGILSYGVMFLEGRLPGCD